MRTPTGIPGSLGRKHAFERGVWVLCSLACKALRVPGKPCAGNDASNTNPLIRSCYTMAHTLLQKSSENMMQHFPAGT